MGRSHRGPSESLHNAGDLSQYRVRRVKIRKELEILIVVAGNFHPVIYFLRQIKINIHLIGGINF